MRTSRIVLLLALLSAVACVAPRPPATADGLIRGARAQARVQATRAATIKVDPSRRIGALPRIYRAGSYLWYVPDPATDKALDKFLAEQRVGTFGILLDSVLESSKSLEDLSARLSQWDSAARKIAAHGGEVIIEIWSMPPWLSASSSAKVDTGSFEAKPVSAYSPPRDYNEWAKVVYTIVDHFNNRLKVPCGYQIWMEPDLHWLGTEEEYLKLYKYSVFGAKKADPAARIGGPGLATWDGRYLRVKGPLSANPGILNFIRYCSENAIPELGLKRLPIDFIVWHHYNVDPFNPFAVPQSAEIIRKWLARFGYAKSTPLIIGEWTIWQEKKGKHPYFSPEHDTEIAASYIVAMLNCMQKAGIDSHMFTTIFETQFTPNEPEFTGNFGLFTKNKIIKPSYNAFRAVSMLAGNLVATTVSDEFLTAIGTADADRIAILVANFFPYGAMADQVLLTGNAPPLPDLKHSLPEIIAASPMDKAGFDSIIVGKTPVEKLNLSEDMKKDLKAIASYINRYSVKYADQEWRRSAGLRVSLELANLPLRGSLAYSRYVIDSRTGNSIAALMRMSESARKGIANINELPDVKLSPVEQKKVDAQNLRNVTFEMAPYSVALVVLSK